MNGLALLNSWLKNNDPYEYIDKVFEIYNAYNTKSKYDIINRIKHWWIEKVSYPLLRYNINKSQIKTAKLLYNHPDFLVFVVTRFLVALQSYSNRIKDVTPQMIIDNLFPNHDVVVHMKSTVIQNGFQVYNYSIYVRSFIPATIDDDDNNTEDKVTITNLEVDVHKRTYVISQKIYNTNKIEEYPTADILFYKEYRLEEDGKLSNPNYALDRSLLDEDLIYYKIMISQLLIFVGGMFDTITTLYFADLNSQSKK